MHTSLYFPIEEQNRWRGRQDALTDDYLFQRVQYLDLNQSSHISSQQAGFALLGFECDEGVRRNLGNIGAKEGPAAFRQVAGRLSLPKPIWLYDAGNVRCLDRHLEAAQLELKKRVAEILALQLKPIVIGGGHETAWGHFQGIAEHEPDESIAILNFDSHFDLRPLIDQKLGSSGTSFGQIHDALTLKHKAFYYYCAGIQPYANTKRLFDYADSHGVQYLLAEDILKHPYDLSWIEQVINNHQRLYVSICLDVFNAAIAPGVSAPQALGIPATFVIEALKLLGRSQRVVSLDIVELAPQYDLNHQTAKLAANLFLTYCLHTS